MRPNVDYDASSTAAHMPTMAARRILIEAAVADTHALQKWDIPGAFMKALGDPRNRQNMAQPPELDG